MLLGAYRAIATLAKPAIEHYLARRVQRGKESPERLAERRGVASLDRPDGPLVWVHAASVGEAASALPLIDRLLTRDPECHVLLTTGTVTSAAIAAKRLPDRAIHQFVPVDRPAWVRRFLDHWRPDLAVWIESEFWPTLLSITADRGIPMVLLNGRLSPASLQRWRRAPGFLASLVTRFSLVVAQTEETAHSFRVLGAADAVCLGNLKFSAPALPADEAEAARLAAAVAGRPVWLAASTHPGEEVLAAEVHAALSHEHPSILTLIAIRHPGRSAEVERDLAGRGLTVAVRSRKDAIGPGTDIYLIDTMGELGCFYRLVDIVYVGGGMADHGGHNPIEAAQLDCAILYGPDRRNFADVTHALEAEQATEIVGDAPALAEAVRRLLADGDARSRMAAAARTVAARNAAVIDRVMDRMEPFLPPRPAGG